MKIVLRVVASGHISVHFDDQPATSASGNGGEVIVGSEGKHPALSMGETVTTKVSTEMYSLNRRGS
jgi:hypothetical protein